MDDLMFLDRIVTPEEMALEYALYVDGSDGGDR